MASSGIEIRGEVPDDAAAITEVTAAAFLTAPHSSRNEQFIVDALRRAGKLAVSRVAVHGGQVIGHIAVSPVKTNAKDEPWFGFQSTDALVLPGVPQAHFMAVSFGGSIPNGIVSYHEAFKAQG